MSQGTLDKALELIDTLDEPALREVERAVRARLEPAAEAPAPRRFHQALLAAGLVREIRSPAGRAHIERPLVPIQGPPLSQTIVEERR
jgi:hypothetical protein